MLGKIIRFEIMYRLRRPAVYIYALVFFGYGFLTFVNGLLRGSEKAFYNSPSALSMFAADATVFMLFVCGSLLGMSLYRDLEYNTKPYYFTYPITKSGYFWGRFLGAFLFVILIDACSLTGAWLGNVLGPALGLVATANIGPHYLASYLQPFLLISLPNLFVVSAMFFILVAFCRNIKVVYAASVFLLLFYWLSNIMYRPGIQVTPMALIDPFGGYALKMQKQGYPSIEENTRFLQLSGLFSWNRIIWMVISITAIVIAYRKFSFDRFANGRVKENRQDQQPTTNAGFPARPGFVKTCFLGGYNQKTLVTLTKVELLNILRDNYFLLILLFVGAHMGFIFFNYGHGYIQAAPSTVELVNLFNRNYPLIFFVIILFYTGEVIFREKAARFAAISDTLPPPDWVYYGSKLLTMVGISIILTTLPICIGMAIQTLRGYTGYDLGVYLSNSFAISFPLFCQMATLCFVIHVLVNNKFAGHAVGLAVWGALFLIHNKLNYNYNLFFFSYTPTYLWTEMNGLEPVTKPLAWFTIYWLLGSGLLVIAASLFFVRGRISSFRERKLLAYTRINRSFYKYLAIFFLAFVAVGGFIYYNVSYLNNYLSQGERAERSAAIQDVREKYASLSSPDLVALKYTIDILPDNGAATTKCVATIVNHTDKPIEKLILDCEALTGYDVKYNGTDLQYEAPLLYAGRDTALIRLYTIPKQLMPGDSAILEIESEIRRTGFQNDVQMLNIIRNGSFINELMPFIGNGRARPVSIEATISTPSNQVAVAPGTLTESWETKGRKYVRYVQNNPEGYRSFAAYAARYDKVQDSIRLPAGLKIGIGVYHHGPHRTQAVRFMQVCKDALASYSSLFGDYPFDQFTLVESSHYQRLSSFPGLLAYPENYEWNAELKHTFQQHEGYYRTATQVARQWWGLQMGLAKYSALELVERKTSPATMKYILAKELKNYLILRQFANEPEKSLLASDKGYVYDNKLSIILYGLKDLIGADSLNAAIRAYREKYGCGKTAPYIKMNELYACIEKQVPDSIRYYLLDGWKQVTLYQNKILSADAKPTGKKDEYKVSIRVMAAKLYVHGKEEKETGAMNDLIDIGIFSGNGSDSPAYLRKHRLQKGETLIEVIVQGRPHSVGIDPYNKLIDQQPEDNFLYLSNK